MYFFQQKVNFWPCSFKSSTVVFLLNNILDKNHREKKYKDRKNYFITAMFKKKKKTIIYLHVHLSK